MGSRTYLVGGAVRDELLGLPVRERDWVVTGATPEELERRGFRQVGASFPVFLHPESSEEYALARTERKQGHGYHGFTVSFGPDVTIEQDLERRDLTINAMARDESGHLIDPYGGRDDLEARVLRHVSPAFVEDPLRVLRVARFASRFHNLGFTVHEETLGLLREIAASGELTHLVPERAWAEIHSALDTDRPSVFLDVMRGANALAEVLPEVDALFGVPQPEEHHPEVDTGVHVGMALDAAADAACTTATRVAVLLHDLGKGLTDPADWPQHVGHEEAGVPLVEAVCARFRASNAERTLAVQVCRHHLDCHRLMEARPGTVMKLLEAIDALRKPDIGPFVQACAADYRGRGGRESRPYPQGERLQAALRAALGINARDLEGEGLAGPELGDALRAARIQAIAGLSV